MFFSKAFAQMHFHSSSLTNLIKCAVDKLRKAPLSLVDICLGMLSLK